MSAVLRGLLLSFGYFSILPIPRALTREEPDEHAFGILPFVGMIVGSIGGAAAWLSSYVFPHSVVTAIAFALPIVLTGAIHIDGFLDSCDALWIEASVERRLAIFKDPHHGTFAVAGIAILSVFWLAALWALPAPLLPLACCFSEGASRLCSLVVSLFARYARPDAMPRIHAGRVSLWYVIAAALVVETVAYGIAISALALLPFLVLLGYAIFSAAQRRLDGGMVGDVYGFLISIANVTALLGLILALRS